MLSVILLTLATATVLPILVTIYQERIAIQQQEEVLDHLEKVIQYYLINSQIEDLETPFTIKETIIGENLYRICVKWFAANQREYERCLYAKK